MAPRTHELTAERLKEVLDYDALTGVFRWRVSRGGRTAGSVAGSEHKSKGHRTAYIVIRIDGVSHLAHQLIWLYVYGEKVSEIDHRDGNGLNNKLSNLKFATHSQNRSNVSKTRANTSGFKGICAVGSRWKAQIRNNRKQINLGTFDTKEAAHVAYCCAAVKYHGEFANFGGDKMSRFSDLTPEDISTILMPQPNIGTTMMDNAENNLFDLTDISDLPDDVQKIFSVKQRLGGTLEEKIVALLKEHGGDNSYSCYHVVAALARTGIISNRGAVTSVLSKMVKSGAAMRVSNGNYKLIKS